MRGGSARESGQTLGCLLSTALLLWSTVLRHRNTTWFLVAVVVVVECAFILFALGFFSRNALPLNAIAATSYAFVLLAWIYAVYLARSSYASGSNLLVFTVFIVCDGGFMEHLARFAVMQTIDVAFDVIQGLVSVMGISIAMVLAIMFGLEAHIVCGKMQAQMSREMENLKTDCDKRIELIRQQANEQLKNNQQESCRKMCERFGLTRRETEVVELTRQTMTRAAIAQTLVVSENTVKYHLRNAYRKLDVHNAREMIMIVERFRTDVQ